MVDYIIDESRRSGFDRRDDGRPIVVKDRRAVVAEEGKYITIIQKIPIFKGLMLSQFKKILRITSRLSYNSDNAVIKADSESKQMFIIIKGALKVVFPDGKELTRITPVEIVGEMGLFTGERRSASVLAAEESLVLVIRKNEMLNLFRKDSDLGLLILTNVIRDISHKLKKSNTLIDELKHVCNPGSYTQVLSKMNNGNE